MRPRADDNALVARRWLQVDGLLSRLEENAVDAEVHEDGTLLGHAQLDGALEQRRVVACDEVGGVQGALGDAAPEGGV